jgi:hypothetical protein
VLLEEELEEELEEDTNPMAKQENHILATNLIEAVKDNIRRFSVREKLEFVLAVLESDDVETLLHGVRLEGYLASELTSTTNQREFRRMRNIYKAIVLGTDRIVCKDAIPTAIHKMMLVDLLGGTDLVDKAELKALNSLKRNTLDLSICGHSKVSAVASALLSGSFWKTDLDNATRSRFIQLQEDGITNETEAKYRQQFGKARFTTARTNLQLLQAGKELAQLRSYIYRVDPRKLISGLDYLTTKLPYRPGMTRSMRVGGFTFHFLPVYQRGGKSLDNLFAEYKTSQQNISQPYLGEKSFVELTKMMTKKGQSKTGLSTYYVKLSHAFNVFNDMLRRLTRMDNVSSLEWLKSETKMLREDCDTRKDFLTYRYSKEHIQIEDKSPSHCCRHSLNGVSTCSDHSHEDTIHECKECSHTVNFFEKFTGLIGRVRTGVDCWTPDEVMELDSMAAAAPALKDTVLKYMGHRVRAYAQFHEIKLLYQRLSKEEVLIIIDHKQKILGMKFREGQVEYFGKQGMSLLGAMMVQRIWIADKNNVVRPGLRRIHFDLIFDQYKSQDSRQVLGALQELFHYIKLKYPDIKKAHLLSDNASCFASHDCIPFMYHLNKKFEGEGLGFRLERWLFTEACTGKDEEDTHFSFVSTMLNGYMLDGHDINTETDIFKALQFQGGLAGSHTLFMDAERLAKEQKHVYNDIKVKREFKATKTGVRATHEIEWPEDDNPPARVRTISGITEYENISAKRINNFKTRKLDITISQDYISPKKARFRYDNNVVNGNEVVNGNDTDSGEDAGPKTKTKEAAVREALNNTGIEFGTAPHHAMDLETVPITGVFNNGWACYPKNQPQRPMKLETMKALIGWWMQGNKDKSAKVSAERARDLLVEGIIRGDWEEQLNLSIPKIKAFFSKNKTDMDKLMAQCKVLTEAADAVHDAEVVVDMVASNDNVGIPLLEAGEDVDMADDVDVPETMSILDSFEETVLGFEKEQLEEHVRTECTTVVEFPEEDLVDFSTVDNGS